MASGESVGKEQLARQDGPDAALAYLNPGFDGSLPDPPDPNVGYDDDVAVRQTPPRVAAARPSEEGNPCTKLRRKLWTLPIIHTQFWLGAAFAIVTPLFSQLADSRDLEQWKRYYVSLAFKVAMLLGFVCSERLMVWMEAERLLLSGQGGFFIFIVLFGSLYWSPSGSTILLPLAITAAAYGGFIVALYRVSMFSMMTARFRASAGVIIAYMECLWRVGSVVGWLLGGVLVELWTYPLPFFVLGGILMLSFPVMAMRGPIPVQHRQSRVVLVCDCQSNHRVRYRRVFLDSLFLVDMVVALLSSVTTAFNETTLEPHLQKLNLSSTEIETAFSVQTGSYCVGSLVAGVLSLCNNEASFMLSGQTLLVAAFFILGPAPIISFQPVLWTVYVCQACIGMGTAALFVSSFSHAIKRLLNLGYQDSVRTTGFVACVIFTFQGIGAVTTPRIARHLVENLGYRLGSMPLLGTLGLWWFVTFAVWINFLYQSFKSRRPPQLAFDETELSRLSRA